MNIKQINIHRWGRKTTNYVVMEVVNRYNYSGPWYCSLEKAQKFIEAFNVQEATRVQPKP